MDAAFENYLALSAVLREDLLVLLDSESNSQCWRRNFVRASASLIEGYVHCLREMCAVSFECTAPQISSAQADVIRSERSFNGNERLKFTLTAAHALFELQPGPNFGGSDWVRARRVLARRNLLMHPKTPTDLCIPDSLWAELRDDVTWLLTQLFNVIAALQEKHSR